MIELRVRRFGRSLGVVLPRAAAKRLRLSEGESVFLVEEADGTFRLISRAGVFASKMAKADGIMGRYGEALRKLAQ